MRLTQAKGDGKPTGWDQLAKVFLYKLEMASENSVKVCLAQHLVTLVKGLEKVGSVLRWTESILSAVGHHLDHTMDGQLRLHLLTSLSLLVVGGHTLASSHSSAVFEILVRLLYNVTKYQPGRC